MDEKMRKIKIEIINIIIKLINIAEEKNNEKKLLDAQRAKLIHIMDDIPNNHNLDTTVQELIKYIDFNKSKKTLRNLREILSRLRTELEQEQLDQAA